MLSSTKFDNRKLLEILIKSLFYPPEFFYLSDISIVRLFVRLFKV